MGQTDMETSPDIRALLIGIDQYAAAPVIRNLSGCVNDVDAVYSMLTRNAAVKPERITRLTNAQATRQAILDALSALVGHADIKASTQVLIHYSGHGSQMSNRDGSEPDGLDETMVPHDARTDGPNGYVFDIPDKTLAALIDRIAQKTKHITVVLDCCHSGSGTRALDDNRPSTRRAPQELRQPPLDLDGAIRGHGQRATRGNSGWAKSEPTHVLLAGCLDKEESNEHDGPQTRQGAMTYFWLEYLRQMPKNATYADAHAWVKSRVNALYRIQTPQCEGDTTRTIFGGAHIEADPFVGIKRIAAPFITLDGGQLIGLDKGARLDVFPGTAISRSNPGKPLAQLEVISAGPLEAMAQIVLPEAAAGNAAALAHALLAPPFEATARCLITFAVFGTQRTRVWLNAASLSAADALALNQDIEKDDILLPSDRNGGAIMVERSPEGFVLTDASTGKLMVEPASLPDPNKTYQALRSVARWRIVQSIANAAQSALSGKVTLALHPCLELAPDNTAMRFGDSVASAPGSASERVVFSVDEDKLETHAFVPVVTNGSASSIYVTLLLLNQDFSVISLYPFGQEAQEAIAVGGRLEIGKLNGRGSMLNALPNPGWARSDDQLRLFVSTLPLNLEQLQQDALSVPATRGLRSAGLAGLLEAIATTGTRGQPMRRSNAAEDWTVVDLPYSAIRKTTTASLIVGQTTVDLGQGFALRKPAGMTGTATLSTADAATRGESDRPQLPMELLKRLPGFDPLQLGAGTRGTTDATLVIDLDLAPGVTRGGDSLTLTLPAELAHKAAQMLPIAFDGEDFLIAGYGEAGEIKLVDLPDAVAPLDNDQPGPGGPTRRGIINTVRLYLLVKSGRPTPDLGLRLAEMIDGEVTYTPVPPGFLTGMSGKIAVLVHGFTSDTRWLVRDIPGVSGVRYDHLLTWDYETLGTGIDKNGKELAFALERAGLNANDTLTVHVYSHSMGTLVTRCMIELHGGDAYVDQVVLAGPPNKGTSLANESRGLLFIVTEALNMASPGVVIQAGNWIGQQFHAHSQGWQDLMTTSVLVDTLRSAPQPARAKYLVLAGTNSASTERASRLQRIWRKTLDKTTDALLGEPQNDMVIGLSSMSDVRGRGSTAKVETSTCDHFSYYADEQCIALIRGWVK